MSDPSLSDPSLQSVTVQAKVKRGGCLTTWLVFLSLGNIGVLFQVAYPQFMLFISSLSHAPLMAIVHLVSTLCVLLSFIGVYGLWLWKRWGLYLVLGPLPISAMTYLVYGGFALNSVILGIIVLCIDAALWYFLLRNKWQYFH